MQNISYLHFEILRVASQRINASLLPSPMIVGDFTAVQVRRAIADLIAGGFATEVCNKALPTFRTAGADGFAVVITDAGRAIAQDPDRRIETTQSRVLDFLTDGESVTLAQIAEGTGISCGAVRASLIGLRDKGFEIVCRKDGRFNRYTLPFA
jgi:biotin operon repressor